MKKAVLLVLGIVSLAVVTLIIFISQLFAPASTAEAEAVSFVVPKGQAVSVTANKLAEEGLIKNPLVFRLVVKQQGLDGKLQAGSFSLKPTMTPAEIAEAMTQGTNDVWITIPEGWRREEIAESLAQEELPAFDEQEFLALTIDDEGKLFPDTYLIARESTAPTVRSIFLNTFEKKIVEGLADEIEDSEHSLEDALIMASIVEREASGAEEMRMVAGILWKRIEIGMPLQADATLQYAKGYNEREKAWWTPPLGADRQLGSLFNTYLNPGLPPRPIANPGLNALKAALNPKESGYLYYLHDPQGGIHYAQTLEEHNANVQRYLR